MRARLAAWVGGARAALSNKRTPTLPASPIRAPILEQYVRSAPSPQNALDLFGGEWWSRMPGRHFGLNAGTMPLFVDDRMEWAISAFGGVKGKDILELGPLEGGHTYMLEKAGARSVLAIEGNSRAFLRCLIVKEILELQRAHFVLGDFVEYLRSADRRFDAAVACGVLYHMQHPVEVIHGLGRVTDQLYVWTHYYDEACVRRLPHASCFSGVSEANHEGFAYRQYVCRYSDALKTVRFTGGNEEFAHWLTREDLLGALRHAGFTDIQVRLDDPGHDHGPCIELVARRADVRRARRPLWRFW